MLIFLASSDWPSITERWWPSAWPANRPVNVNNQPVTCYGETGSAPERCWYTKSYHLKPHQLCRTCIIPDAAINWKKKKKETQQGRKRRPEDQCSTEMTLLATSEQARIWTSHPEVSQRLTLTEKYKNMKDDISVFALPFCGIITSSANTRPDTGAIQGWHKNEILSP